MTLAIPPPRPVSIATRLLSFLGAIWSSFTYDLAWHFRSAKSHQRADVLGPYYLSGAPDIGFEAGKGILGAMKDMKESPLFLFSGKILGPNGEPVHATLDLWQANTTGVYTYTTYNNRGVLRTSPTSGSFEVLTVPPGEYGPLGGVRAAHIHAIISAEGYESLVTQIYVCRGNDGKSMEADFLNYIRPLRPQNMLKCWAIPTEKGDRYNDFPPLDASNTEAIQRVKEWNERLGGHMRIECGGEDVIRLNRA